MLSLLLWQTKIAFAGRANSVNVSFSVADAVFHQAQELARLFAYVKIPKIFFLPFVDISREGAEEHIHQHRRLKKHQQKRIYKQIQHKQSHVHGKQKIIELIRSVSAHHKSRKGISQPSHESHIFPSQKHFFVKF